MTYKLIELLLLLLLCNGCVACLNNHDNYPNTADKGTSVDGVMCQKFGDDHANETHLCLTWVSRYYNCTTIEAYRQCSSNELRDALKEVSEIPDTLYNQCNCWNRSLELFCRSIFPKCLPVGGAQQCNARASELISTQPCSKYCHQVTNSCSSIIPSNITNFLEVSLNSSISQLCDRLPNNNCWDNTTQVYDCEIITTTVTSSQPSMATNYNNKNTTTTSNNNSCNTSTTTTNSNGKTSSINNTVVIVGIASAVVVVTAACITWFCFSNKKRSQKRNQRKTDKVRNPTQGEEEQQMVYNDLYRSVDLYSGNQGVVEGEVTSAYEDVTFIQQKTTSRTATPDED